MARPATAAPASARLTSLDAYRGFVMVAMASAGIGLKGVASRNPNWAGIADQFEHRDWVGCTFWDLIQPSFMFIVGVAMVMSYAIRQGQGQAWPRQAVHALKRAALLCLVGMFLDWYGDGRLYIQFIRVLQQIAIGYLIAFTVLPLGPKVIAVTAILLLVGHSAAYITYGNINGVDPWAKEPNFGRQLDILLHLPLSRNHYVTFNALSSASTIMFGVLVGELLRGPASHAKKLGVLVGAGLAGLLIGFLLSGGDSRIVAFPAAVPMIKRLWTASFAIFAAGWTCLMLALFYAVIECLAFKLWSFPFLVVGMNSIAMYVIASMFRPTAKTIANLIVPPASADNAVLAKTRLCDLIPVIDFSNWSIHWGVDLSNWYLTPMIESLIILSLFWFVCFWFYRRQIFFKL